MEETNNNTTNIALSGYKNQVGRPKRAGRYNDARCALRDLSTVRIELDRLCFQKHRVHFPKWLASQVLDNINSKLSCEVIGRLLPSTQEIIHSHQLDIDPQALADLVQAAAALTQVRVSRRVDVAQATDDITPVTVEVAQATIIPCNSTQSDNPTP